MKMLMESEVTHPPIAPPAPRVQAVMIADDLTGACDSGVMFAERGVRTMVVRDESFASHQRAEVIVYSTNGRDLDGLEASRRLRSVTQQLPGSALLFKKVDSVFRGNTLLEIGLLRRLFPDHIFLLAPAYPALRRRVEQGVIHAKDLAGCRAIPAVGNLRSQGHRVHTISACDQAATLLIEMEYAIHRRERFLFADAQRQVHLEALVEAAQTLNEPIFWVGSGGLASALARHHLDGSPRRPVSWTAQRGPCVFFAGSTHPVTRHQIVMLREHQTVFEASCVDPIPSFANKKSTWLLRVPRGVATENDIRRTMAYSDKPLGCLLMTGGETADLVCHALGIHSLELIAEFTPGLPLAIAHGGRYDGTHVILKSGGFGDRDVLCQVLNQFSPVGVQTA